MYPIELMRLILLAAIVGLPSFGAKPDWCSRHLADLAAGKESKPSIESVEDMLWAFSNGLLPKPEEENQLRAFELYLTHRFGNATNATPTRTASELSKVIAKIATTLREHPELAKTPFRSFNITSLDKIYPVTPDLDAMSKSLLKSAADMRSNTIQMKANIGFWRRLFGDETEAVLDEVIAAIDHSPLKPDASSAEKEQHQVAYLRKAIPVLINKLRLEHLKAINEGRDATPISEAAANLVRLGSILSPSAQSGLRSKDGRERLATIRSTFDARDQIVVKVTQGTEQHFSTFLENMGLAKSRQAANDRLQERSLSKIEKGVLDQATFSPNGSTQKEIRQLSLMEAPFRSCIGGTDCSSRTYLTRALDPNYQYFTMTDANGQSSGHVTIVLGDSKSGKMAFIDKVMNVPNEELPIFLEAVRRSALEKGYTLILPADLGDNTSGISNTPSTTAFMRQQIKTEGEPISGFVPHAHEFSSPDGFTRANKRLTSHKLAPLELPEGTGLSPGVPASAWKTETLDLDNLVKLSRTWRRGDTNSKIRYVDSQATIRNAGLEPDPAYNRTISKWLRDPAIPFSLKKKIILLKSEENWKWVNLIQRLSLEETSQLYYSLLDTPRLRDRFFTAETLADTLVPVRQDEQLVKTILNYKKINLPDLAMKVLQSPEIPAKNAKAIFESFLQVRSRQTLTQVAVGAEAAKSSPLADQIEESLLSRWKSSFKDAYMLQRALEKSLQKRDALTYAYARKKIADLIEETAAPAELKAILARSSEKDLPFVRATEDWLRDPKVDLLSKARYLQVQTHSWAYENRLSKVPKEQRAEAINRIRKSTLAHDLRDPLKRSNAFYFFSTSSLSLKPFEGGDENTYITTQPVPAWLYNLADEHARRIEIKQFNYTDPVMQEPQEFLAGDDGIDDRRTLRHFITEMLPKDVKVDLIQVNGRNGYTHIYLKITFKN